MNRSEFRAYCRAEYERFDASDTPVARVLRRQREKQARQLRRVRIGIYLFVALDIVIIFKFFYGITC